MNDWKLFLAIVFGLATFFLGLLLLIFYQEFKKKDKIIERYREYQIPGDISNKAWTYAHVSSEDFQKKLLDYLKHHLKQAIYTDFVLAYDESISESSEEKLNLLLKNAKDAVSVE